MERREGIIVFLPYAKGTKSEGLKPYLYETRDSILQVWKKGDNPFQNNFLNAYDGKYVIIEGNLRNGVFEIENIQLIKDGEENE